MVGMGIVVCNLARPAIKNNKKNKKVLTELVSLSSGLAVMSVLFSVTWIFAPLAYIRAPDLAIPDFYPVFQVSI